MSYPLSTFCTCISGIDNCTNNFQEGYDYVLSGKSCYIVLTSDKWFDVDNIITSSVSGLSNFYVDYNILSGTSNVQFDPYGNQQYTLTGNNYYISTPTLCSYNIIVDDYTVYEGVKTVIFEKCSGSSLGFGRMKVTLSGSEIETLWLINCGISGIIVGDGIQLSNLNSIALDGTCMGAMGFANFPEGNNNFFKHLADYGPENGNIYATSYFWFGPQPNPLENLTSLGKSALHTLTASKGWTLTFGP